MTGDSARLLSEFAASLDFDAIPSDVTAHIKLCLLDTTGCGLFGSTLEWTRILLAGIQPLDCGIGPVVWGTHARLSASHAALLNGSAVHGFELDDLHARSIVHPGSVVAPAALAMAEQRTGVTGKQFITALVAGYEVTARVGMSMGAAHLLQGWHPTGTHGTFGAAAACGSILGLTSAAMLDALGIAGSQSGGLMAAQYGSMVKRMHAGRAAQSGVYAAALADQGYTGIKELFDDSYGSYTRTFSPRSDTAVIASELGDRWEARSVGFKRYAANGSCHPTIDALLTLRRDHNLRPDQVQAVEIRTSSATYEHVGWPYAPDSVTTAQMNLQYIVAVVLADGDAFVDQFTATRIRSASLIGFTDRVRVIADPEIDALGDVGRHATRVEVRLVDGSVLRTTRDFDRADRRKAMSADDVETKFFRLAERAVPAAQAQEILELIQDLERLDDVSRFASSLIAPSVAA